MSEISASPFKLPPEQEAIRAKCFHPSGTFVEFPIEDVETSIHEAQSSGNWSAYGSKFSTFVRSASTTTFLIWAGIRLQQRGWVSQVIKKFQLELPLKSLFQSPTIAEMAAVIRGASKERR